MKTLLFLTISLSALLLSACTTSPNAPANRLALDDIKQLETVTPVDDEIVIPYKKYELDNGLTIVLHQDKSDPLVHVDVTYHVGSAREEIGKSGFAHFFEHMMFQGSENVADEQHFSLITESGGTLNGSTSSDRTNYYQTIPSNQLERILWLESDRMGFFLDAVTQKKFENQRETVKNERGQNVDNRPYGLLWERVGEALFPEGHPYSWSTIGYIEDLNRANLNDLKAFFLRWYGPNNATLTIGGDFDEAQTLAWIKKYFGGIPRGPEVEKPNYEKVTLEADRYISMEDNVSLPLMFMSYPTVHAFHPDEAPLDVLMDILGGGKTSLLYKNMVKSGKSVQAQAGHACRELSCEFTIMALPTPGNTLKDLKAIALASLDEFEQRGANDDDLLRVKSGIVSGKIYSLESVSGKVRQLAAYQTFQNTPNLIKADIARYENVTKEDVMRVYKQYIKNKPAVIMSIVPKGMTAQIIQQDTWKRYERKIPKSDKKNNQLALRPGTSDFDRSVIPPSGTTPQVTVPELYNATISNGIKIWGTINSEVPTTTLQLRIPAGQTREPINKLGLASLTASLLDESTLQSSAESLANELAKLGSSISFSTDNNYTNIRIKTLSKHLEQTLNIALEKLTKPLMNLEEFERLKKQQIETLKFQQKEASPTANTVFAKLLFGRNNSISYANQGTLESVRSINLEDVKSFYKTNYGPANANIMVVSNLSKREVKSKLDQFANWQGNNSSLPQLKPFPELQGGVLYLIDKPNAAQSEIRIGNRSLPYDATGDYYKLGLMNYNLGGAFNSRINLNLREDKGYTYGARSSFMGENQIGQFTASSGVRADATAASIREFRKEITLFQTQGITTKELAFMRSAISQREARAYETPTQKLRFLSRLSKYNLEPDYIKRQNEILATISSNEINSLAKQHLNLDDMITVVVGDKELILNSLTDINENIIELSVDGLPITEP